VFIGGLMRRIRILVTEDNPVNPMIAKEMLTELGCEVDLVTNGAEAIEKLSLQEFDLVFMDCMMPVLDGYAATQKLRSEEKFKSLPIIALTANAMSSDRDRCLESGMSDYLAKPILLSHLEAILEKWLPELQLTAKSSQQNLQSNILNTGRMQKAFLEDCERVLEALRVVQPKGEPDQLMSLVHQLKSTCAYFGYDSISVKCRFVEYALKNGTLNSSVQEKIEDVLIELGNLVFDLKEKLAA